MAYANPTVTDFKSYFDRDFPFEPDVLPEGKSSIDFVRFQDIQKAISSAVIDVNQSLFVSESSFREGFFLATAHYLVMNLRASSQGISGSFDWLESSKSVGSVSASYQLPTRVASHPRWSILCKTHYGARYVSMIYAASRGTIFTVRGATRP